MKQQGGCGSRQRAEKTGNLRTACVKEIIKIKKKTFDIPFHVCIIEFKQRRFNQYLVKPLFFIYRKRHEVSVSQGGNAYEKAGNYY